MLPPRADLQAILRSLPLSIRAIVKSSALDSDSRRNLVGGWRADLFSTGSDRSLRKALQDPEIPLDAQ